MVHEAVARKLDWHLTYVGRSRATLPFADRIAALDPARVKVLTDDESGPPDCTYLVRRTPKNAAIYCCGPASMIDGVRSAADHAGTAAISAFHVERFTAAPITDGHAFELELSAIEEKRGQRRSQPDES
jgi:ferredoxin-NADP reductase